MANTKAGGIKLSRFYKEKYGVDENGKSIYHKLIGAKGGSVKNDNKGFGSRTHKEASEAGQKGGRISRRRK